MMSRLSGLWSRCRRPAAPPQPSKTLDEVHALAKRLDDHIAEIGHLVDLVPAATTASLALVELGPTNGKIRSFRFLAVAALVAIMLLSIFLLTLGIKANKNADALQNSATLEYHDADVALNTLSLQAQSGHVDIDKLETTVTELIDAPERAIKNGKQSTGQRGRAVLFLSIAGGLFGAAISLLVQLIYDYVRNTVRTYERILAQIEVLQELREGGRT